MDNKRLLDSIIEEVDTKKLRSRILDTREIINRYPADVGNYSKMLEIVAKFNLTNSIINELNHIAENNGFKIIILKAAFLNGKVYTDKNMRNFTDIDIWVAQDSFSEFVSIIKHNLNSVVEPKLRKVHGDSHEKTLIIKNVPVDIHNRICNPNIVELNEDMIYNNIVSSNNTNSCIYHLSTVDNIIQLTTHLLNDGYYQHHSLVDIIELIKNEKLRINEIIKRTEELGCIELSNFLLKVFDAVFNNKAMLFPKKRTHSILLFPIIKTLISIKFRGINSTLSTIYKKISFKRKSKENL